MIARVWLAFYAIVASHPLAVNADEELRKHSAWTIPDSSHIVAALNGWFEMQDLGDDRRRTMLQQVESELGQDWKPRLDVVVEAMRKLDAEVDSICTTIENGSQDDWAAIVNEIEQRATDDLVRRHLLLFAIRHAAHLNLFDEVLDACGRLSPENLLTPEYLLFYQAVAHHQLAQRPQCIDAVTTLLSHQERLPARIRSVALLMKRDIEVMENDSLNEIGRLMRDIQRRQSLARAGQIVLDQESAVIEKLDKLIADLENEKNQNQQQASQNGGAPTPMDESRSIGGKGDGEVTSKPLPDGGSWGDLPPADQDRAIAEMTRDMPPHFRGVIEEYFRQLAKESDPDRK